MGEYVAMLRGVNVGGRTLRMQDLRAWLEALGLANVRTYVQSGNAVFTATGAAPAIAADIEAAIARGLGEAVPVFVKTSRELAGIVERNPLAREEGVEPRALHVTFLRRAPTKAALTKLAEIESGADRWHARGSEIYLFCPNGYGRTKLSNGAIERAVATTATTRNWNSVNKLLAMASGEG